MEPEVASEDFLFLLSGWWWIDISQFPDNWEKLNRGFPTFFRKCPDCVADPFGTVPRRRC